MRAAWQTIHPAVLPRDLTRFPRPHDLEAGFLLWSVKMVKFVGYTPILLDKWVKQKNVFDAEISDRRQLTHYWFKQGDIPRTIASTIENRFVSANRPFFNVYPKIADSLLRTSLSIKPDEISCSVIHDMPAISIHLPVGSDTSKRVGTNWFIVSMFIGEPFERLQHYGLTKMFGCDSPFMCVYCSSGDNTLMRLSTCPMDRTFAEAELVNVENNSASNCERYQVDSLCKLALGIMFLASDPDYIKPVLLKADENKTTPLEERIERAKRRGVFGFTVGEDIERSPHFRRPHFAIRWTGKGGSIPKLVPVKGSVIGKELMTTVPTGFEVDG
jgi:hypothetical protein